MTRIPLPIEIGKASTIRAYRSFVPKLKWPTLDNHYSNVDLTRFPTLEEEVWRYGAGDFGAWSDEFVVAVRRARERVWLIDGYLLKVSDGATGCFFDIFGRVLSETFALDIRLLTSAKTGHKEHIEALRVLRDERRAPPRNEGFTIEVGLVREGRGVARLPHDRFAIIDDELWHWGANVGGTHREINAFSRGWPAHESGASDYFERLSKNAETLL